MGRIVLAEKSTCERTINQLLTKDVKQEKLGLLIGKLGDENLTKDHIVHVVATPDEDSSEEKHSSKVSWVTAHAKQVIRMLPGGLNIIGIFAACPSTNFDQMKTEVQKMLGHIDKLSSRSTLGIATTPNQPEYLVLHICTSTKKVMCRSVNISEKCTSFRPAEMKIQPFIQQWTKLHTMSYINHPYLTTLPDDKQQTYLKIQNGLKLIAESILESSATVSQKMYDESTVISTLISNQQPSKGRKSTSITGGNLYVDLYLNPPVFPECDVLDSSFITYSGCVQGLACIPSKSTLKDALTALKTDLIRSIVGRFRILYEDVLETNDEPILGCLLPPKRAVIDTDRETFTDYIFESETEDDVSSRVEEIMNLQESCKDSIKASETFPVPSDLENISIPRARPENHTMVEEIVATGSKVTAMTGLIIAVIAVLISIIIGKLFM